MSLDVYLQGFEDLFIPGKKPEEGIPFGATLLISGAPGAGKTTFAISLARALMLREATKEERADGEAKLLRNKKRILYFISSEITIVRLREAFRRFGWFARDDGDDRMNGINRLFHLDHSKPDDDNLYVITPDPATDRPVPTPEEMVNDIFGRISKSLSPSEAEREDKEYIVIVDSITALLKGCISAADERRQTHELLYRLRALFGTHLSPRGQPKESEQESGRLVMTILLAEQDQPTDTAAKLSSVEDYLADIVFRLSNKWQPLGRRFREIEVVKSQGVNMIPGEHSWAIVTDNNCDHYLRHPVLKKAVERLTFHDERLKETWGTIVIFARARMLHKSLEGNTRNKMPEAPPGEQIEETSQMIHSGTAGLDEMLICNPEYWLPQSTPAPSKTGALLKGTTTLVAGPIGAGKTTLCLQFLLNASEMDPYAGIRRRTFENEDANIDNLPREYEVARGGLFVSLNADAMQTVNSVYRHLPEEVRQIDERLIAKGFEGPGEIFRKQPWSRHIAVLDFNQSLFDFNHLMAHLNWAIDTFMPNRIAFDGVSEWLTTFNKSDAAKMLEAIGVLIANHRVYRGKADQVAKKDPPTVFMTFDMNTREDPLAPQATGISADYIIALKQINLLDEIRKVIYILKSADARHDPTVREIAIKRGQAYVRSSLDNFNGLLAGKHRPAEVLLQLFQENYSEQTFNAWLNWRLKQLSNLQFKSLDFSRSEIGRMFEDFDSRTRFPAADLKILSVDEWWLASQRRSWMLHPELTEVPGGDRSALLNLATMWHFNEEKQLTLAPNWRDFWLFEVDKCGPEGLADLSGSDAVRYAVPASIDFGLFCINRRMIERNISPFDDDVRMITEKEKDRVRKVKSAREGVSGSQSLHQSNGPGKHDETAVTKEEREDEEQGLRNITAELRAVLLDELPRYWAASSDVDGISWFDSDSTNKKGWPTLVSLMRHLQDTDPPFLNIQRNRWGFSFDMGTRETCVCVFFEIAWSFGASAIFLTEADAVGRPRSSEEIKRDATACETALKFLMFLVLEGLMPVRASVETTRHSLFSRHFYSTLQSALDLDRWDGQNGLKDDEVNGIEKVEVPPPHRNFSPSIVAIPFFPLGFREADANVSNEWRILLEDVRDRFHRLKERGFRWLGNPTKNHSEEHQVLENEKALAFWTRTFLRLRQATVGEEIEHKESKEICGTTSNRTQTSGDAAAASVIETSLYDLRILAEKSVQIVKSLLDPIAESDQGSEYMGVTLPPDLVELIRWHLLRLRMLGHPLGDIQPSLKPEDGSIATETPATNGSASVSLLKVLEEFDKKPSLPLMDGKLPTSRPPTPTGFGCTGSWMYGIHHSARSASLAREVLQEITSLGAAEERARRGAGIPTRRDFFELHGLDAVPSMDYMNWNQLLRYCACRARRRERVLPKGMANPARVYGVIQKQMMACLDRAALWSQEYINNREAVVKKADQTAREAMSVIQASVSINSPPK